MADDPSQLDFDLSDLDDLMEAPAEKLVEPKASSPPETAGLEPLPELADSLEPPAKKAAPAVSAKRRRPLSEVAMVVGGVFLVVGLISWVLVTFVFVERPEEETALELPRNRMEAVLMELPVGEVTYQSATSPKSKGPQTVFIVEIDASIIVHGTSGELIAVEKVLLSHHHRIEEAIEETIRAATPAHLNEPDALTIRTQVRDRINHFLGRPIVREVLFSHYRAFRTPIKT